MQGNAMPAQSWKREAVVIRDGARIGTGRVAHPDPGIAVHVCDGVALQACGPRHIVLTRHLNAGAGAVVNEAVVGTFDCIAFEAARGQRQSPVRAAILERDKLAHLSAEENDGFAEKCPPNQRTPELVGKAGGVPALGNKHGKLPRARMARWVLSQGCVAPVLEGVLPPIGSNLNRSPLVST